jgi:hypothetical protein
MPKRRNFRRHERQLCEHKVIVSWSDDQGDDKVAQAYVVDISPVGMRLHMPAPPPLRSYVSIYSTKLGPAGAASVRYCYRTVASNYAVGAEFTGGFQWTNKPSRYV